MSLQHIGQASTSQLSVTNRYDTVVLRECWAYGGVTVAKSDAAHSFKRLPNGKVIHQRTGAVYEATQGFDHLYSA